MSSENTKVWDELKRVPPEHLKGFQRSGGFKGTAIKPMWTIHKMTEVFGQCGHGWGINEPKFQVVPAGDEVLVFCTVAIWTGNADKQVYGVGGDKALVKQSSGLRTDDEAFKKAYTDALTNACKMLGAGADIHMGLWDGNKYTDDEPVPASKESASAPKDQESRDRYTMLQAELRKAATVEALKEWAEVRTGDIAKLPNSWKANMAAEYKDQLANLKAKAA